MSYLEFDAFLSELEAMHINFVSQMSRDSIIPWHDELLQSTSYCHADEALLFSNCAGDNTQTTSSELWNWDMDPVVPFDQSGLPAYTPTMPPSIPPLPSMSQPSYNAYYDPSACFPTLPPHCNITCDVPQMTPLLNAPALVGSNNFRESGPQRFPHKTPEPEPVPRHDPVRQAPSPHRSAPQTFREYTQVLQRPVEQHLSAPQHTPQPLPMTTLIPSDTPEHQLSPTPAPKRGISQVLEDESDLSELSDDDTTSTVPQKKLKRQSDDEEYQEDSATARAQTVSRSSKLGRRRPKGKKSNRHFCSLCTESFTRSADLRRHNESAHTTMDIEKLLLETRQKHRMWCLGCKGILSRVDARRRHESTCAEFRRHRRKAKVSTDSSAEPSFTEGAC